MQAALLSLAHPAAPAFPCLNVPAASPLSLVPPGKGSSEWVYAWVPFVGPFAGGAIAGGLFVAVQTMNHSALP